VVGTVNRGFGTCVQKKKIGATYRDVKEQRFGGTRFWTTGLGILLQK
jgi:hypothetical protein